MNHEFSYLLSQVNKVVGYPNMESLRVGTLDCVRECIRKIGVKLVCNIVTEEIEIVQGRYRFPEQLIQLIDLVPLKRSPVSTELHAYQAPHDVQYPKHRWEYRKTAMELIFPNLNTGTATISYYALYLDEQGEILIPDEIYMALKDYCTWKMLDLSNNIKNPKWQERRIMQQEAYIEINAARGHLNEANNASSRTSRRLY